MKYVPSRSVFVIKFILVCNCGVSNLTLHTASSLCFHLLIFSLH
uniref:Uncharacterized protein n=1 Tax=Rhizophora mucronata TaxID=61149 RepID=A0A2P2NA88_RHIMU